MELELSTQIAQAAAGILVGAGLGLYYDLLRLPRLLFPGRASTLLCDLLFCLGTFAGLFLLGLGPGAGQLRLFMCLSAGLGFALWGMAPGLLLHRGEVLLVRLLKRSAQKIAVSAARDLQNLKKSGFFKKISFQKEQDGLQ